SAVVRPIVRSTSLGPCSSRSTAACGGSAVSAIWRWPTPIRPPCRKYSETAVPAGAVGVGAPAPLVAAVPLDPSAVEPPPAAGVADAADAEITPRSRPTHPRRAVGQ